MSADDFELQSEEFEALTSILDETTLELHKTSAENERTHGILVVEVTLPEPFYIEYHPSQRRPVQHLPPIFLRFELPADYPSVSPPSFKLECLWLSEAQIDTLTENLKNIWSNNVNEPILFLWYSSLGAEALDWLNISNHLRLCETFPPTLNPSNGAQLTSIQVAAAIYNYEREKKLLVLIRSIVTCPICVNDVYGSDCFSCYACSSVACKSCIKSYLETLIHEGQVKSITCPINPTCHVELTPAQIASLVDRVTFHRYDRLLFQISIESMDDIIFCPRCQKPVIISRENENDLNNRLGECATCSFVFCTICGRTFHGVNPCQYSAEKMKELHKQYQDGTPEERAALEQKYGKIFGRLLDEMASMETIRQTAKQCPHCSMFVDKLDGCNKMTCVRCHGYFCWLCLQRLSKTDPYGHFSAPQSKCFQKLFEGVTEMNFW